MEKKGKTIGFILLFTSVILFVLLLMQPLEILKYREHIDVLFPKGIVALEERNLLFIIQAIMLLVILPVYILTFIFSWKYRARQSKAKYDPDLTDSRLAEYLWWGIPFVLTLIIAVITWIKTYQLDPYKPIASNKKPLTIQVIALQWKWLFIYPEEKIASVNFLQFPLLTPLHFEITADAPMNSFWIPDLGGQIYAMPQMRTELNLIAQEAGSFRGSSANLSGEGFAGMHFIAKASSEEDYLKWIQSAQQASIVLNKERYNQLVTPTQNDPPKLFLLEEKNLFDQVLMKGMKSKGK